MVNESNFVNNFAQWQPDQNMTNCLNCHTHFSFLIRKHHCRCCGGIFCASCANNYTRYDSSRVRIVKRQDAEEEYPPFRTCDSCYDNLLHMGLLRSSWGKQLKATGSPEIVGEEEVGEDNSESPTPACGAGEVVENSKNTAGGNSLQENTGNVRRDDFDEENSCPICNAFLGDLDGEMAAEQHVAECVQKAEMIQQHHGLHNEVCSPTSQNRMLVYKIPPAKNENPFPECPICFEEMIPGNKVGRLECLCVFHYKCIKSWFNKKAQKTKSNHVKNLGKNCCPLHDAIF